MKGKKKIMSYLNEENERRRKRTERMRRNRIGEKMKIKLMTGSIKPFRLGTLFVHK